MGLVDYTSSDSEHEEQSPTPRKKRRTSSCKQPSNNNNVTANLPPLPTTFHNLYATTVRTTPHDDPSLHQNRRRAIPHKAGNWPSHIYIEWHPPPEHHSALTKLIDSLTAELTPHLTATEDVSSLLDSDLGAPLPLHISLSRPFVLRTEEKDGFLADCLREIRGADFALRVDGLRWFRSPDSGRSFLVLRVLSSRGEKDAKRGRNPELASLLETCNELVAEVGQPRLYSKVVERGSTDGGGQEAKSDGEEGGRSRNTSRRLVDDAFHVSIAWSFAEPTAKIQECTAAVFARSDFQRDVVQGITIPAAEVKVKIGNVVTTIALEDKGRKGKVGGLFGI